MSVHRRSSLPILRLSFLGLLAALALLAGCANRIPNPTPAHVDVVLAGRFVDDLRALDSFERDYFLRAMRWCEWQREPFTTTGAEYMFEIRPPEGRGIFVYASGSNFSIGRLYCELPASTAAQLRQMVFPEKR